MTRTPEGLDIYVLGAGASYVHGAPLTDQILPYALTRTDQNAKLRLVRKFLRDVFSVTAIGKKATSDFPSLVDVLSVVDMALDRKESLAKGYNQDMLRKVRQSLEYAIFRALEHSLSRDNQERRSRATGKLVKKLSPSNAVFISFNYDVIIDIALARRAYAIANEEWSYRTLQASGDPAIDYGLEFANLQRSTSRRKKFRLYKLHGSFNWLLSPETSDIYYGGPQKAIALLFDEHSQRAWNLGPFLSGPRRTELQPIIITPTHLKDLRNAHLVGLWRRTEEALRQARRITFVGYSFPGDDLHIKYLFKHALETRRPGLDHPAIVVVDYVSDAESQESQEASTVQRNYERFFGRGNVEFHGCGFDEFVKSRWKR